MKRFTETTKWRDPWYRKLSGRAKNLWQWLLDHCDNSGVVDIDLEAAAFDIREAVNEDHLSELSSRLKKLDNGKYWITKFVRFQYGTLSPLCRPHANVIQLLRSHGLMIPYQEEYAKGISYCKDKDKDKDKEPDKEKDKDTGKEEGVQGEKLKQPEKPKHVPQTLPCVGSVPEKMELLKAKLSEMFRRPPEDAWSFMDNSMIFEVAQRERVVFELSELWKFKMRNPKYFPRSLSKLLGDWTGYLDQSRAEVSVGGNGKPEGPVPIQGSTSYTICPGNNGVMGA